MADFRKERDFLSRKLEVERVKQIWPNKIPIILLKHENSHLPLIKQKFLCPDDFNTTEFVTFIRKKMKLQPSQSLFISTDSGTVLSGDRPMQEIYSLCKDKDDFLYLKLTDQVAYGLF